MLHKKLPHLICFALATNYLNVFMSTTVLLGLTVDFWGASNFSNPLAPWASGSSSLMLRAVYKLFYLFFMKTDILKLKSRQYLAIHINCSVSNCIILNYPFIVETIHGQEQFVVVMYLSRVEECTQHSTTRKTLLFDTLL